MENPSVTLEMVIQRLVEVQKKVERLEGKEASKLLKQKEKDYEQLLTANAQLRIELEKTRAELSNANKAALKLLEKLSRT